MLLLLKKETENRPTFGVTVIVGPSLDYDGGVRVLVTPRKIFVCRSLRLGLGELLLETPQLGS